jgi:hypothetical protein
LEILQAQKPSVILARQAIGVVNAKEYGLDQSVSVNALCAKIATVDLMKG